MSQFDFGTIDPNTKSGTQLASDLNDFRDALNSGHSGATRPVYAQAGTHWVRTVSSTQWDLVFYDGTADYTLRSVNPTTSTLLQIPKEDVEGLEQAITDVASAVLKDTDANNTGAALIPSGTTAQRPGTPTPGMWRHNATLSEMERYQGGQWLPLNIADKAFNEAPIVTLASAATVDIGAAAANTISISGSVTITSLGTIAAGARRTLVFQATPVITHNATSLILPGSANITAAAGDVAEFVSLGSGNWRCISYQRASGDPIQKEFVSSEQTITAAGLLTIAHGLGVKPKFVHSYLVVKTAFNNWAVGDEIFVKLDFEQANASAVIFGYTCKRDATNLIIRFGSSGIFVHDANTAAFIAPATVAANCKIIFEAFA